MRPFVLPSDGDGKATACSGVGRSRGAERGHGGGVNVETGAGPPGEARNVPTTVGV